MPPQVTEALREGREILDPKLTAPSAFADKMLTTRGLFSKADVQAFLDAGYEGRHVLEIIPAIAVRTLCNYSKHLLLPPLHDMFARRVWEKAA